MMIEGVKGKELKLKMPVWAPGSYPVRVAKNVEDFQVKSKGEPAKFEKSDKNTWTINLKEQDAVDVTYKVYANELSVRTSFVNTNMLTSTVQVFSCMLMDLKKTHQK